MLICAATGNSGKLKELRRILEAQGHQVKSQKELGITLDPEETGTTFEQNAVIKAQAICQASGLPTVADDSGLSVDALNGEPGVYSARYCGRHGDDEANNDKLLQAMADVPQGSRAAHFTSAVCLMLPTGQKIVFMGECPGRIGFERQGTNGFGYDPLFIPDFVGGADGLSRSPNAQGLTYAQLEDWQKDAISHRGAALREMKRLLPGFLQEAGQGVDFTRNEKEDGEFLVEHSRSSAIETQNA